MNNSRRSSPGPIFIVSGGRGLAGNNMVQSLLIQYPDNNIPVLIMPNIRNEDQLFDIVMQAKTENGLITHTLVNPDLRKKMNELCDEFGVRKVDFMGDLAGYLEDQLEIEPLKHPGLFRELNQEYFERVESIEYTLSHDDGLSPERLHKAEIVLTGVSRSGKTPLSVYLAMFGWKVANVPLVKGIQPPEELFKVNPKRVFGLHIGVSQLIAHRKKRMQNWKNHRSESYIDEKKVKEEIRNAMFIFDKGGFTVLNVTNKPIESTANEILRHISERFSYRDKKLQSPYHDKENNL